MKLSHVAHAVRTRQLGRYARGYVRSLGHRSNRNLRLLPVKAAVYRAFGVRPSMDYLEMHVVDHCNLRCKGCSHFSSISPARFAEPEAFARDLGRMAELFSAVHTLRIMGGEPLMHPRLAEFVTTARAAFPRATVALVTNGLLLPKQDDAFWRLLAEQRIRLDISRYPVNVDVATIEARCARHGIELRVSPEVTEFCSAPVAAQPTRDAAAMLDRCRDSRDCPFLQDGRLYHCATIALAWILEERFGRELPVGSADFVDIHDVASGWEVLRHLASPAPWCARCELDRSVSYPWDRTTGDETEWLAG